MRGERIFEWHIGRRGILGFGGLGYMRGDCLSRGGWLTLCNGVTSLLTEKENKAHWRLNVKN